MRLFADAKIESKQLVTQHNIQGQFPVLWYRVGKQHVITYGCEHVTTNSAPHAAEAFGGFVLHQLTCDGRLG